MDLSCSTFRFLPDGLSGAPGWGAGRGGVCIAWRSAPASAGTPPAQPKTEAPGERVPHPGLWLQQQQQQEQQEQQGHHPPRLEAHGSQSSPRGPRLRSRERSREHHRYPYRQCHGYRVAGARQQHVPGRGLRWASAPGWPRHLGAWGGRRSRRPTWAQDPSPPSPHPHPAGGTALGARVCNTTFSRKLKQRGGVGTCFSEICFKKHHLREPETLEVPGQFQY